MVSVQPAPLVARPGAVVVGCHSQPGEYVLLVEAEDQRAVGALVAELAAAGWSVVGVEPTVDALEDAFRSAVGGVP